MKEVRGPNSNLDTNGPKVQQKLKSSPDKMGVYNCPFLRIAENQEWGKDKRRTFCQGLMKTTYFSFCFDFFWFGSPRVLIA